jgi:hypothetical protein
MNEDDLGLLQQLGGRSSPPDALLPAIPPFDEVVERGQVVAGAFGVADEVDDTCFQVGVEPPVLVGQFVRFT